MIQNQETMTIVVPVFNRPELVVRCLDSLSAQTWRPIHIIVVDNGSTDDTAAAVGRWQAANESEGLSLELLSDPRRGAAYARQTGLEHTLTDKVMFFDSDDVMRPDNVASVMEAWKSKPEAQLVVFPIVRHLAGAERPTHSATGNLLERHLVHAILQTECFAVKTAWLRSVGGWRGEYPNWNDFETGTRILLREPEVVAISRPLADVYPQKESITGVSFSAKAGLWEKSLDGIERSIKESGRKDIARLLNIVAYRRAVLAACYAKEGRMDLAAPLCRQALRQVSATRRPLIRFAYHWTRLRLRGAFILVGPFL